VCTRDVTGVSDGASVDPRGTQDVPRVYTTRTLLFLARAVYPGCVQSV
jgi:hypothetical protein